MTGLRHAVFAIPGDMHRRTGGFIYEARVLGELRALGHRIDHIELPASFPEPDDADIARTVARLSAVPADVAILLDGFIPGTIGPEAMARIAAQVVPVIHHPLGLETGLEQDRAARLLRDEAAALRHAAHIVVPSAYTARLLTDRFGLARDRITVAPPGAAPWQGRLQPVSPPLILSVGILAARKGHDVLLDALASIRDLDWQARIVGATHDPTVADALHARCRAIGLADRVRFTGLLSDDDLAAAYDAATIFALATRFEGYGMVFAEAMWRGLPIVTCDAGAVPDTVGAAARLVPVDAPDAFAAALSALLRDGQARAALAADSARAGAQLKDWSDTALTVSRVLERVMMQRPLRD